jgi:hypothetical protein
MKIILTHKITEVVCTITTDNDDAHTPDTPLIEADGHETALEYELVQACGFAGHTFDLENCSNIDLAAAVRSLPSFDLESIEPEIMPDPLPEGAVS